MDAGSVDGGPQDGGATDAGACLTCAGNLSSIFGSQVQLAHSRIQVRGACADTGSPDAGPCPTLGISLAFADVDPCVVPPVGPFSGVEVYIASGAAHQYQLGSTEVIDIKVSHSDGSVPDRHYARQGWFRIDSCDLGSPATCSGAVDATTAEGDHVAGTFEIKECGQ